jgi:hypothetical protein
MPTLAEVRDRIRKDLRDTDAAQRWSDAQLDRHIDHAMSELSAAMPRELSSTLATTAGSRDLSLASLTGLIEVEAVEFPVGSYPPAYLGFHVWAGTLTLHSDTPPTGGNAKLYYLARHPLDGTGSSLSSFEVDVLVTGAAAYAALEQGVYTTDRVTTGKDVTERFTAYGRARLTAFHQLLMAYGRRNRVRQRRAFVPA